MNLGQLLDGQEAVTAFNKGIQLMIASGENETFQVCLSCHSQGLAMYMLWFNFSFGLISVKPV